MAILAIASGAHIKEVYDLVELGLAYRDDVEDAPQFRELEQKIKRQFSTL